jgi:hypothetical protein
MALGSGRSNSGLSRGGPRIAERGPAQYLPSEHSEHQYEGLLKGVGITSKEPIVSKRSNSLAKLHMATHFAIGCNKWDEENARGQSTSHATFRDPEVVYATRDCPDKNASIVELRQRDHIPETHYRTEQRERFDHPGNQPKEMPFALGRSKVHFGNDTPELVTVTASVHHRPADNEAQRAAAFRSAGLGALVTNTVWDKPPRVHPITAGPRSLEAHDFGHAAADPRSCHAAGGRFGRISSNRSALIMDHNVRDPVAGVHIPLESYKTEARTTYQIVEDANRRVPHLRSLGALRPHPEPV